MGMHVLRYNRLEFVLNTKEEYVDVYNGMWRQNFSNLLPNSFTWENIKMIFGEIPKSAFMSKLYGLDKNNLAEKLFEFYK